HVDEALRVDPRLVRVAHRAGDRADQRGLERARLVRIEHVEAQPGALALARADLEARGRRVDVERSRAVETRVELPAELRVQVEARVRELPDHGRPLARVPRGEREPR